MVRRLSGALVVLLVAGCGSQADVTPVSDAPKVVTGLGSAPHVAWSWKHHSTFNDYDSIVPLDDGVFVGIGHTIARLDQDGHPLWVRHLADPAEFDFRIPGTDVVIGMGLDESSRHGTTAISLRTGRVLWFSRRSAVATVGHGIMTSGPRDIAYVDAAGAVVWTHSISPVAATSTTITIADHETVSRVDPTTGKPSWSTSVGGEVEGLVASDGLVVVTTQKQVKGLDGSNGHVRWTRDAKLGASVGLLTDTVAWVLPVHSDDEDNPRRAVDLVDARGHDRGSVPVPSPAFQGRAFQAGGSSYILDSGRLDTITGKHLQTYDADKVVPSSTGLYGIDDTGLALFAFDSARPVWRVDFPDGGGLSADPVDGAVYVVLPSGVERLSD